MEKCVLYQFKIDTKSCQKWSLCDRNIWQCKGSIRVQIFDGFDQLKMSHVTRKPVFGVSYQVRLKPAYSATETS